jgi:hypothetical protein
MSNTLFNRKKMNSLQLKPRKTQSALDDIAIIMAGKINRAQLISNPFPNFNVLHFLPEFMLEELRLLSSEPKAMSGTRAQNNGNRTYFTPDFQAQFPAAALVCGLFQHSRVVEAFAHITGGVLQNTHLLVELATDTGTSSLVPHRDIGPKRFTGLFFLSEDPNLSDAGTDLYTPKKDKIEELLDIAGESGDAPRELFEERTLRPTYAAGRGYFFLPSTISWHGFDKRTINGIRKTIIVNYVGPTKSGEVYRNRHNLAYPDEPVSF